MKKKNKLSYATSIIVHVLILADLMNYCVIIIEIILQQSIVFLTVTYDVDYTPCGLQECRQVVTIVVALVKNGRNSNMTILSP